MEKIYTHETQVYYGDTDCYGVVYYANYLRFAEMARCDLFDSCGVSHKAILGGPEALGFPVIHVEMKFIKSAVMSDKLKITARFTRITRTRITVYQEIYNEAEVLLWKCTVVLTCVAQKNMRVCKMSDEIFNNLNAYLSEDITL